MFPSRLELRAFVVSFVRRELNFGTTSYVIACVEPVFGSKLSRVKITYGDIIRQQLDLFRLEV